MAVPDPILAPTADFVTSSLNGALAAAGTSATIGTGLDLPATNGLLQIDYDSTVAVGTDEGPETITYTSYTSGTGALAGLTRGVAGTTDVAHSNNSSVQQAPSTAHYGNGLIVNADLSTTAGEIGAAWATWTPTLTGFHASSTATGNYIQIGKTVHFTAKASMTGASTGAMSMDLPVNAKNTLSTEMVANGFGFDGSFNWYIWGVISAADTLGLWGMTTVGRVAGVAAAVPTTWANTDTLTVSGTYEAA